MSRRRLLAASGLALGSGCLRLEESDATGEPGGGATGTGRTTRQATKAASATATETEATTTEATETDPETTTETDTAPSLDPVWEQEFRADLGAARAGELVVGGSDGLAAVSMSSGVIDSSRDAPERYALRFFPLLTDRYAYVAGRTADESGNLVLKLDLDAGEVVAQNTIERSSPFVGSPCLVGDELLLGIETFNDNDTLYTLDAETLEVTWSGQPTTERFVGAATVDGAVFTRFLNYTAFFSLPDFTLLWEDDGLSGFAPPVAHDGLLYLSNRNGVHCLDPENRETKWQSASLDHPQTVAVVADTVLAAESRYITALDRETGAFRWQASVGDEGGDLRPAQFAVEPAEGLAWGVGRNTLTGVDIADGTVVGRATLEEGTDWVAATGGRAVTGNWRRMVCHEV
ncbi:hypothetical protein [Haloarchaeobius sp. DYHT-AS-18]|uniref:hypothetical protein n=1 Tax=Haloarchaeobius sp. DYHT-AS-18 TaxID=3446117 RepID=UPI003EBFD97F